MSYTYMYVGREIVRDLEAELSGGEYVRGENVLYWGLQTYGETDVNRESGQNAADSSCTDRPGLLFSSLIYHSSRSASCCVDFLCLVRYVLDRYLGLSTDF